MKTEISAKRFIKDTEKPLRITNLSRVNILFGKNGTGKSSFLKSIYGQQFKDFHLVVPERGGGNMIYQSNLFDQENKENESKNARAASWDGQYRERAISRTVAITQSVGYKKLKKVSQEEIDAASIEGLFSIFLPEISAKLSDIQPHAFEFYREDDEMPVKITDTTKLSTGQVEALSLASDIVTQAVLWKGQKKCVLVDEPDAHLHLDLQNRFAIFLEEVSIKFDIQFVITSHSQALMAALMNVSADVSVVCLDTKSEEIKGIKKDTSFIFSNLLSSDLALAKILGRKIMIVEGNDDFLVWNQAARNRDFEDIALIEAGGEDIYAYKKYAEAILGAISDSVEQAGVTLCDRDDKEDATHDTGSILPLKRLQCSSIENLLLTNEVLQTIKNPININEELDKVEMTEQEGVIITALKTDRRNTKIPKELLQKIHSAIDIHSNTSDWRIRVGKVLGRSRPIGELEQFIGGEIVSYVWGQPQAEPIAPEPATKIN